MIYLYAAVLGLDYVPMEIPGESSEFPIDATPVNAEFLIVQFMVNIPHHWL